jgi:molybdopterin-containing oxidoreductase family membrane subunit
MLKVDEQDKRKLIEPLYTSGPRFWVLIAILLVVIGWGLVMYVRQLQLGLGVTGMQRPVYWAIYMVNFIFFIGISHAGTLISAILRVVGAEWRRPITRIAEAITAFALVVGTLQIIIDMGRPDRLLNIFLHGRLQSPILWDVLSVTAYFLGSVTYLYLPIIPDAAILRDNFPENGPRWRKWLYSMLSLGWRGNRAQWVRLEKAIAVMAVLIIPVAISVHTIISWILATTVQPGWHSTIFGPYFVVGAIFSGIGALFVAMTIARKVMGLESYITPRQYRNLGLIFITMNAVWMYFTYAEYLTLAAGQEVNEFPVLASKMWGEFAPGFWLMVVLMVAAFWILVAPQVLPAKSRRVPVFRPRFAMASGAVAVMLGLFLVNQPALPAAAGIDLTTIRPVVWGLLIIEILIVAVGLALWFKPRPIAATVTASIAVLVGMWLERWNIVVPTMTHPYLVPYATYHPSLTEISLTAASFAIFILMFVVFFKLFPVISIWEVSEGRVIEASRAKVTIPMPELSTELSASQRIRLGR